MNIEEQYLNLLQQVKQNGILKQNRTGIAAYKLPYHTMIQHNMANGFPLLTTKKMGIKSISTELEFFIKGITDKKWLKDRKCTIWNEWCNPNKIPKNLSEEEKKNYQLNENDLGYIYGFQWRNFNNENYDQLKNIINTLKNNPNDRRMIVSAWNPLQFDQMALPPCHVMWGIDVVDNKLNLWWTQRSVDIFLGLPYNIASYALLLKLLCKESNYNEGILTGFLVDVHLYENHTDQANLQLSRTCFKLPELNIINYTSIFNWEYTDLELKNYISHDSIKASIAV